MATQLNDIGDSYLRTTDLPSIATFTMMTWLKILNRSTDANQKTPIFFRNNGAGNTEWIGTYIKNDNSTTITRLMMDATATAPVLGSTLTITPNWHHITLTRSGDVYTTYLNGVQDIQFTDASTITNTRLYYGGNDFLDPVDAPAIEIGVCKIWDGVALTETEILREMTVIRPVRYENIHAWHPMWSFTAINIRDYSGNGFNWTEQGVIASVKGPHISFGGSHIWVQLPQRRWILGTH